MPSVTSITSLRSRACPLPGFAYQLLMPSATFLTPHRLLRSISPNYALPNYQLLMPSYMSFTPLAVAALPCRLLDPVTSS
jgi:hypothetical protein